MAYEELAHSRSCSASGSRDESCTCALQERIYLRTEQEMHAAWRKRAEESESECSRLASRVEELEQEIADRDGIIRGLQELMGGKEPKSFDEIKKRLKEKE